MLSDILLRLSRFAGVVECDVAGPSMGMMRVWSVLLVEGVVEGREAHRPAGDVLLKVTCQIVHTRVCSAARDRLRALQAKTGRTLAGTDRLGRFYPGHSSLAHL